MNTDHIIAVHNTDKGHIVTAQVIGRVFVLVSNMEEESLTLITDSGEILDINEADDFHEEVAVKIDEMEMDI